jgi:hypothetical protein
MHVPRQRRAQSCPVLVVGTIRWPHYAPQRFQRSITCAEESRRLRRPPLSRPHAPETDQAIGDAALVADASKYAERLREQARSARILTPSKRDISEVMHPTRVLPQAERLEQADALLIEGCCTRVRTTHPLDVAELPKEHRDIPRVARGTRQLECLLEQPS